MERDFGCLCPRANTEPVKKLAEGSFNGGSEISTWVEMSLFVKPWFVFLCGPPCEKDLKDIRAGIVSDGQVDCRGNCDQQTSARQDCSGGRFQQDRDHRAMFSRSAQFPSSRNSVQRRKRARASSVYRMISAILKESGRPAGVKARASIEPFGQRKQPFGQLYPKHVTKIFKKSIGPRTVGAARLHFQGHTPKRRIPSGQHTVNCSACLAHGSLVVCLFEDETTQGEGV